jgi:outer membrane protein assembly factor BamB
VLLWKKPLQAETFERRLEQVWRTLIADGGQVFTPLGTDEPLSALDGATGAVIRSYRGTEGLQEVVKDKNTLFVVRGQDGILALRADSGGWLWEWEPGEDDAIVPLTLSASGGKVFVKTETSVHCLSAEEGETVWKTALEGSERKIRLKWPREKLLVADRVVLCSYGGKDPTALNRDRFQYLGSHPRVHEYAGKLAALSAEDGRVLWRTDYLPGLESTPGEIYVTGGLVWLGPDFAEPRDLHTGRVASTRPVIERLWTTGHHYRCYPGKATCRYILTAKRGIEMIDLIGENHSRNNWVRATCRVGVTPSNGLLYAPPHSCGCYMEAKLCGFWALAPERTTRPRGQGAKEDERLQRGPAYGHVANEPSAVSDSADWRTYRGDPARSGSTTSPVPSDIKPVWKADVGGRLSAATIADDRVLVAQVDAHTVHALDADSGTALWRFTAGGRVDSPPTLCRGLVLFGSRDGRVYCLRASDGALVWRFRAAPQEINAVAYEQVESLWPVHGSVLIHNGIAYVAAGRSSYLDGGIALYGLNPQTGQLRYTTSLKSEHAGALDPPPEDERAKMRSAIRQNNTDYKTFLAPDRSDAFSMRGALPDVLTADGQSIFMRHLRFDGQLAQLEQKRPHLFSTSSLLDDAEHHRSYWVLGTGDFSRTPVAYPWIVSKSLAVPYGLMMVFDDKTVWQVRRVVRKADPSGYALFATSRPDTSEDENALPDFQQRLSPKKPIGNAWTTGLPLRPRAMVRANDRLFIAGMPDYVDPEQPPAPGNALFEGRQGGLLQIVACSDGQTLARLTLDSPPVWDGMAVANNRLFISSTDGSVQCWGNR